MRRWRSRSAGGSSGTGLYVWRRRPGNNIGPLMTAVGFSGLREGAGLLQRQRRLHGRLARRGADLRPARAPAAVVSRPASWRAGWTVSWSPSPTSTRSVAAARRVRVHRSREGGLHPLPSQSAADPSLRGCQGDQRARRSTSRSRCWAPWWRSSTDAGVAAPRVKRGRSPRSSPSAASPSCCLMASLIVEQADLSSDIADALTLALFGSIACLPFAFLARPAAIPVQPSRGDQLARRPARRRRRSSAPCATHWRRRLETAPWSSPTGCRARAPT